MGISSHRWRWHHARSLRACGTSREVLSEAGTAPGGTPVLRTPIEDLEDRHSPSPRSGRSRRVRWSRARVHRRRRRILGVLAAVFGVFFLWLAISFGGALTNPALGSSMGARAAEWFRGHGGASIVVWAETQWYSHHQPKVGGSLAAGTIRKPTATLHDAHHCDCRAPADAITPHALCQSGCCRRGPVVADRPHRERNTRRLRDDAPTRRHSHELRRRCRLDGYQASQSHALLGQRHPRRWALQSHRTDFTERRHLTRRCLQRWLLDVRRQWRLLHRRQDHPAPANRCSLLRGLQERLGHRRAVGA